MEKLLKYLNGLPKSGRVLFCERSGTTEGYLRKAVSVGQQLGADLCINLERESGGNVLCEDLRPDADWAFIRSSSTQQALPE